MRPRDSKNTHFTVLKEKQKIIGRESRPIRTEAAVKKNGTQYNDLSP